MKQIFIVALFLFPISLLSQTYTTPVRVNLDKSMRADRSPIMKLDHQGNIYISWVSGGDGSGNGPLSMAISTDGGMTFSNHVVSSNANCNSNFQRGGEFIVNTKGHIHMVWVSARLGSSQTDVWYVRSTDMGMTWTTPQSLDGTDDSSKYSQDFPSIACDSSDNLYVSFIDARESQRKKATNNQLYFTKSTDGGMNWSIPKRADIPPGGMGGTCECCSEHIVSSKDGHLYIVYRSNINNLRDIWLTRSYDQGMTFQPSLKISSGDWNIDACPVSGPNIVLDDSEASHIVWRDARDNAGGILHLYYAFVPKASNVTPMNTSFDASGSQSPNFPNISLYGKYKAMLYETFNYGMRYILSGDTTIIKNRPITANGNSEKLFANVIFAADGSRYMSWQDKITDEGDIYFMKETSSLTSAVPAPGDVTLSTPANNSPEVSLPVNLSWNPASNAKAYNLQISLTNTFTSLILDSSLTSTSAIIKGLANSTQYNWRVRASNESGTSAWSPHWGFTTEAPASVDGEKNNSFRIYPNPITPNNQVIHIERTTNSSATLRIVDLLGRELFKTSFEAGVMNKTITLPQLAQGNYYCIIEEGQNEIRKMIVVE
jgi:hypothetical protein